MDPQEYRPKEYRKEDRYRADVSRTYANDQIEVVWEPEYCIHVAECIRGLPDVFDPWRRPWVDVDEADPDEIADVIRRCPTGALHFRRLDGGDQEPTDEQTTIDVEPGGPLYVRGNVRIVGEDGQVIREDTRVALCRCGNSSNQPYCDGSHEGSEE
jgi:uncharacterized Fe-S cluster protein YjdI